MSQRKKYSKEFKIDAINLVQEQGYRCSEAAKSLDIPYDHLNHWIREIKRRKPSINNGERNIKKGQCLLCPGNKIFIHSRA